MEENYLLSLFVAFIFGAIFFKKDSKIHADALSSFRSYATESVELSGVARYLQSQQDDLLQSKVTGVEKYLENKKNLDVVIGVQDKVISGVDKYISTKDEATVSSVSKYMTRQAVQAKEMAKINVTGVEKYLTNRG